MCGIAGFIDFNRKSDEEILLQMIKPLGHRGPDDEGTQLFDTTECQIGLAHKRLSILDISSNGHQPMTSKNERWHIVYNGEIYNYREIKKILIDEGYTFKTETDTEVILNSFDKWGPNAVEQFIGMFAFVIYDVIEKKIYVVRDRAGVKPLYYYQSDNNFLFASELKSFHHNPNFQKKIDFEALKLYFNYGYILAPHTIFKDTYKLLPGSFLSIDLINRKTTQIQYWDVKNSYNKEKILINEEEAIIETEKILKSACEYRTVADVPFGIFLSGGYDSSLITSILQTNSTKRIKTFTLGFSQKNINEAPFAKNIANYLATDHSEYYCNKEDVRQMTEMMPYHYDEPFGDSSCIPTMLISKFAVKDVKVALSADAGDEVFSGYNYHSGIVELNKYIEQSPKILNSLIANIMEWIKAEKIPFLNSTYNFKTRFERLQLLLKDSNYLNYLKTYNLQFTDKDLKKLLKTDLPASKITLFDSELTQECKDLLSQVLATDYSTFLVDDVLVKVDRATMSFGLEGREPLLDHRLIEWVSRLPNELKIKKIKDKKYLLKKITNKYIPPELLDRHKMGFQSPISDWMKNDIRDYLDEYLNESRIEKEGILNYQFVKELKNDFLTDKKINSNKLWLILMFEMWYEKWM